MQNPIINELLKSAKSAFPSYFPDNESLLLKNYVKQIPNVVNITKDIKNMSNVIYFIYSESGNILLII